MKKINHSILKGVNALIILLLGIFGVSCSKLSVKDMYGTPTADFVIKGKVVTKSTQMPIKNINVSILQYKNNTTFTDEQGNFTLPKTYYELGNKIPIVATDIDGEENGSYQTDTIYVDMNNAEQTKKGDGNWYEGEFTKNVTIELESAYPQ